MKTKIALIGVLLCCSSVALSLEPLVTFENKTNSNIYVRGLKALDWINLWKRKDASGGWKWYKIEPGKKRWMRILTAVNQLKIRNKDHSEECWFNPVLNPVKKRYTYEISQEKGRFRVFEKESKKAIEPNLCKTVKYSERGA